MIVRQSDNRSFTERCDVDPNDVSAGWRQSRPSAEHIWVVTGYEETFIEPGELLAHPMPLEHVANVEHDRERLASQPVLREMECIRCEDERPAQCLDPHDLQSIRVAANPVQGNAWKQRRVPVVKPHATAVDKPHSGRHVVDIKWGADMRMAHIFPRRE